MNTIAEIATFLITTACRTGLLREVWEDKDEPEPEHIEADWRQVAVVDSDTTLWERA